MTVPDPHGRNPKSRPFVIIDPTSGIEPGETLVAVAITSTFSLPLSKSLVPMRWNSAGTVETGFRTRCFAKVDWTYLIPVYEGEEFEMEINATSHGKYVRAQELYAILQSVKQLDPTRPPKPRD